MATLTEPIRMNRGRVAITDLVIKDRADNERALATVRNLMGRERNDDEDALLQVLSSAIETFESREFRDRTSELKENELILFLLEENGQSPKDLRVILGGKGHVSELLSGKRKVGPKQALKLGRYFNINPVVFLSSLSADRP